MQQLQRRRANPRAKVIALAIGLILGFALISVASGMAATLTVNTLIDDSTVGDGLCSLGKAISNTTVPGLNQTCTDTEPPICDCPTASGTDTINFSVSGTITLTSSLAGIYSNNLTIDGTGQTITVDGNGYQGFEAVGNLNLNNLTITNTGVAAVATLNGGAVTITNSTISNNDGYGVGSDGTLTITNSTISNNSEQGAIGAGVVTITNSTLSGNGAGDYGYGVQSGVGGLTIRNSTLSGNAGADAAGGPLTITNSTLSDSEYGADTDGGALNIRNSAISNNEYGAVSSAGGTLNITNSTFSNNGYEVYSAGGTLTITNSTFSDNGYGVYNSGGPLNITNSTFSDNEYGVESAEGLTITNSTLSDNEYGAGTTAGGTMTVVNSILASTASGGNCFGTTVNGDYNISDDASCGFGSSTGAGGQTLGDNVDPLLSPNGLQNNGGPTQTIALQNGSPAIAAIPLANCTIRTDQRGDPRPAPGENACAVGAYEGQGTASQGQIIILPTGQDITDRTQQAVVGQLISLQAVLPSSLSTVASQSWSIQGSTIDGSYNPETGSNPPPVVTSNSTVKFYWYYQQNNAPNTVTYKYTLADGTPGSLQTTFIVTPAPTVTNKILFYDQPVGVSCKTNPKDCLVFKVRPCGSGSLAMGFGNPCSPSTNYGMLMGTSAEPNSGNFQWVQIIVGDQIRAVQGNGLTPRFLGSSGFDYSVPPEPPAPLNSPPIKFLDKTTGKTATSAIWDFPNDDLQTRCWVAVDRVFTAETFLEWKANIPDSSPFPDSVPVPLGRLTWGFLEGSRLIGDSNVPQGWDIPNIKQTGGLATFLEQSSSQVPLYPTWNSKSSPPPARCEN